MTRLIGFMILSVPIIVKPSLPYATNTWEIPAFASSPTPPAKGRTVESAAEVGGSAGLRGVPSHAEHELGEQFRADDVGTDRRPGLGHFQWLAQRCRGAPGISGTSRSGAVGRCQAVTYPV